jgi:SAM-dependent methyltransferase
MPPGLLERVAHLKGLATHADLQIVESEIEARLAGKENPSVLEIGAGEGRVVRWLRTRFPRARVLAVEPSARQADELRGTFADDPKVSVVERAMQDISVGPVVDAALWMWSGFTELHPSDIGPAVTRIGTMLRPGGLLVIDVPKALTAGYGTVVEMVEGFNEVREPYGILRTYSPSDDTVRALAGAHGFRLLRRIMYATSTGISRASFILERT